MKALHIRFEAFTATYKMPSINSGVAVAAPVPSYSNIVGLISCCAGRWIGKDETLVGFKYEYNGIGRDLETTRRLEIDGKGNLKRVRGTGIATREFHVNPVLDLYLSNTDFYNYFYKPTGVPTLGRSQDIAWIRELEIIEIEKARNGNIKTTLIPFPCGDVGGRLIRYCDYFINGNAGEVREPEGMILYQVVPFSSEGVNIERNNLYYIDNGITDEVIYMHKLGDVS